MNCPHRLGNAQALLAREDQALLVRAAQALLAREDQALLVREDQALPKGEGRKGKGAKAKSRNGYGLTNIHIHIPLSIYIGICYIVLRMFNSSIQKICGLSNMLLPYVFMLSRIFIMCCSLL